LIFYLLGRAARSPRPAITVQPLPAADARKPGQSPGTHCGLIIWPNLYLAGSTHISEITGVEGEQLGDPKSPIAEDGADDRVDQADRTPPAYREIEGRFQARFPVFCVIDQQNLPRQGSLKGANHNPIPDSASAKHFVSDRPWNQKQAGA
jgi:hypothetical protein